MSSNKYSMKPEDIKLSSAGSRSSNKYVEVADFIIKAAEASKYQFLNKDLLLKDCVAKGLIELKDDKIPYGFLKFKRTALKKGKFYLPPLQNAIGKQAVNTYFAIGPNFIIIVPADQWKTRSKDLNPTVVKVAEANYKKYSSV